MQHIAKIAAKRLPIAPTFTVYEYGPLGDGVSNGTVAEINGRYPTVGWGRNTVSDEVVYVVSGRGALETPAHTITPTP